MEMGLNKATGQDHAERWLKAARVVSAVIGWSVLLAAGLNLPTVWPFLQMPWSQPKDSMAWVMFLLNVPIWLITICGAVAVLFEKTWGSYLIYLATLLSFGGLAFSYIPFSGFVLPDTDSGSMFVYAIWCSNIAVIALLAWSHRTIHKYQTAMA